MPIPESQKNIEDVISFLTTGAEVIVDLKNPDGTFERVSQINPETVYWMTRGVNANTFGRFVFEEKEFERLGVQCYYNMSYERAVEMESQILGVGKSWRHSIDAKSSESVRDKHNAQTTLVDKMLKNKQERSITLKGEMGRSLKDAFLGKEATDSNEE